ncbi:helix-turn-helix transcriptional regulator [Streptomyces sp. NPDC007095]|uniref:helix-turn-helix transcriptional regulator n=1 Tax=Streptomyces sp. NPDC007095 TaxID=3154482 RepID=UPI0033EBC457
MSHSEVSRHEHLGPELACRPAAPALRGQVLGYRGFRFGPRSQRRRLMVPDGVVKIMLGFGASLRIVDALRPTRAASVASLASGVRTTAVVGEHCGLLHGVTVMLTPLAAYRVFAVPMTEWAELDVDPEDLVGRKLRQLTEQLADRPDWESRFALLDRVLTHRLQKGPRCAPEVAWAWDEVHRTGGRIRVDALAAGTGWSRRQLERRFRQQIGPTPKALTQVLRLQEALRHRETGLPWALAAAQAGYHDQPHFDRTFKNMVGCTPSQFRADRTTGAHTGRLDFLPNQITSVLIPG